LELAPLDVRVNAISPGSILFEGGGWAHLKANDPERFENFRGKRLATWTQAERFKHFVAGDRKAPATKTGAFAKCSRFGGDGEKSLLDEIIHTIAISHERSKHPSQRNEVLHKKLLHQSDLGRFWPCGVVKFGA